MSRRLFFPCVGTPIGFQSTTYTSALTANSTMYLRIERCGELSYYFEAIRMSVVTNGVYTLSSHSTIDTYGYIYQDSFNLFNLSENLLSNDDNSCNNNQFKLINQLQIHTTYVLVLTTYYTDEIGNFSIIVTGPNEVILSQISEYLYYFLNN